MVKILLWFVTIIIVLGYVGIEVTSLIALLSVIGLAISLAIQGTLSNLAGGIQVLVSKPFKAGDYIETDSVSGTVSEIGLVYTKIKTYDNKMIMIPNGQISSAKITNYTAEERRRVDLKFNTSYDAPVELGEGDHPVGDPPPSQGAAGPGALCPGLGLSGQLH